jgi:hypothetical protein
MESEVLNVCFGDDNGKEQHFGYLYAWPYGEEDEVDPFVCGRDFAACLSENAQRSGVERVVGGGVKGIEFRYRVCWSDTGESHDPPCKAGEESQEQREFTFDGKTEKIGIIQSIFSPQADEIYEKILSSIKAK